MSEAKRVNVKPSSVFAFLWMPQFRYSFQSMAHIVPVMMRIIAVMFEQSGLLAPNHPATRWGSEGVKRYSLRDLVGEAWFTLRSTRATPYQWAMFSSVMLMGAMVVLAAVGIVLNVFFGLGSVAQAQLFALDTGSAKDTSMGTAPGVSAALFDTSVPTAGGHADYGIMILDKMLRYGMEGTGGVLQNATQALMQVYNTGILVVAGVMLFWSVLAVVVDTAKTGIVGGGRHNMVWAPIRIVFALGLLIPLGSTGFSSGQFMVVKLAEWGSNLASNGWYQYVQGIISGSLVTVKPTPGNMTALTQDYIQMWICRVAYNTSEGQATGQKPLPAPGDGSGSKVEMVKVPTPANSPTGMYTFTNNSSSNMCGTVQYSDPAITAAGNVIQTAFAGYSDPLGLAIMAGKTLIDQQYYEQFVDDGSGKPAREDDARKFACGFANYFFPKGASGTEPIFDYSGDCASGDVDAALLGPPAKLPDPSGAEIQNMVSASFTAVDGALSTLYTAMQGQVGGGSMAVLADMQLRGWAGMGMWYNRISQINEAAINSSQHPITITPGDIVMNKAGLPAAQQALLSSIMDEYKSWWKNSGVVAGANFGSFVAAAGTGTAVALTQNNQNLNSGISMAAQAAGMTSKLGGSAFDIASGILGFIGFQMNLSGSPFLYDVVNPNDASIYPLAQLAHVGDLIFRAGLTILGAGTALVGFGSSIPVIGKFLGGGAVGAVLDGPVMTLISTMGGTLVMAGVMLKYWVPVIPFIRVAFSVLTWTISVFEAVALVPIAALAHLSTEGEGLAGGARSAWILWLNVLVRPILTVIGYVGAMLVFNTFVSYFHDAFAYTVQTNLGVSWSSPLATIAYSVVYVAIIYTIANAVFKMLDLVPNALMRWMGGSPDVSFDDHSAGAAMLMSANQQLSHLGGSMGGMARGIKGMRGTPGTGITGGGGGSTAFSGGGGGHSFSNFSASANGGHGGFTGP